ncbi:MAG: hypothetical protein AAF664_02495 [Planctomycetota bacterium]
MLAGVLVVTAAERSLADQDAAVFPNRTLQLDGISTACCVTTLETIRWPSQSAATNKRHLVFSATESFTNRSPDADGWIAELSVFDDKLQSIPVGPATIEVELERRVLASSNSGFTSAFVEPRRWKLKVSPDQQHLTTIRIPLPVSSTINVIASPRPTLYERSSKPEHWSDARWTPIVWRYSGRPEPNTGRPEPNAATMARQVRWHSGRNRPLLGSLRVKVWFTGGETIEARAQVVFVPSESVDTIRLRR